MMELSLKLKVVARYLGTPVAYVNACWGPPRGVRPQFVRLPRNGKLSGIGLQPVHPCSVLGYHNVEPAVREMA